MRVLVATNETQGLVSGDYARTVEGELVVAEVSECADPRRCGCGRGFPGLSSGYATTTAMIADLPHVSEADLRQAIDDYLDRAGWRDLFERAATANHDLDDHDDAAGEIENADEIIESIVDEHIEVIAEICDAFPVGSVIERSGTQIRARVIPFAA